MSFPRRRESCANLRRVRPLLRDPRLCGDDDNKILPVFYTGAEALTFSFSFVFKPYPSAKRSGAAYAA